MPGKMGQGSGSIGELVSAVIVLEVVVELLFRY